MTDQIAPAMLQDLPLLLSTLGSLASTVSGIWCVVQTPSGSHAVVVDIIEASLIRWAVAGQTDSAARERESGEKPHCFRDADTVFRPWEWPTACVGHSPPDLVALALQWGFVQRWARVKLGTDGILPMDAMSADSGRVTAATYWFRAILRSVVIFGGAEFGERTASWANYQLWLKTKAIPGKIIIRAPGMQPATGAKRVRIEATPAGDSAVDSLVAACRQANATVPAVATVMVPDVAPTPMPAPAPPPAPAPKVAAKVAPKAAAKVAPKVATKPAAKLANGRRAAPNQPPATEIGVPTFCKSFAVAAHRDEAAARGCEKKFTAVAIGQLWCPTCRAFNNASAGRA